MWRRSESVRFSSSIISCCIVSHWVKRETHRCNTMLHYITKLDPVYSYFKWTLSYLLDVIWCNAMLRAYILDTMYMERHSLLQYKPWSRKSGNNVSGSTVINYIEVNVKWEEILGKIRQMLRNIWKNFKENIFWIKLRESVKIILSTA